MFKLVKWGVIVGIVVIGTGLLFFGKDLFSYAFSSGKMLKTAMKDSIPVQFEIQRARDLLEDIIPEMHANLRIVAEEEVEVANLERKVVEERGWVASERIVIQKLRKDLDVLPASCQGDVTRQDGVDQLAQRFDRFSNREILLSGNEKLLQNRKRTLQAAIQKLDKTRLSRVELAVQIEGLEGQLHLLQAQGSSDLHINDTKLAQTQRLLADLKKRLEVAQRVLEREANFTEDAPAAPAMTAEKLKSEIDAHFDSSKAAREPEASGPIKTSLAEAPCAPGSAR